MNEHEWMNTVLLIPNRNLIWRTKWYEENISLELIKW